MPVNVTSLTTNCKLAIIVIVCNIQTANENRLHSFDGSKFVVSNFKP